ncbi:hypothetical protein KJ708_02995 [bacterium]|nr:hypothetical protein [bacterium]MBU1916569.1 hypothetical protein [bacterium]
MYERLVKIKRTRFFYFETFVGLLGLILFNVFLFPEHPAFVDITPHPYWIIVIGIAARYGRGGALLASILAALTFLVYLFITQGLDYFYDNVWILRFPFLFFLIGFLIGEIKTTFILREDFLTARVEELENLNNNLMTENKIIKEAHKDLSVDVATSQETITTLNDIIEKLNSRDPNVVYTGLLECFQKYLHAEECSYYTNTDQDLKLYQSMGWKDYYKRPESYRIGKGLIGLAAKKAQVYSLKDILFKKKTADQLETDVLGDTVLAIPLIGMDNKVYGVASIEKIPLIKLTDSTIQTARIICGLAASSLNTAHAFQDIKDLQITGDIEGLYKYHYLSARLEEEYKRSKLYMLPLSLVGFNWPKLMTLPDDKKQAIIASLVSLINYQLREFDILANSPNDKTPFTLLLSCTSGPQAESIKTKIIDKIKEYKLDQVLTNQIFEDSVIVVPYNPNTMEGPHDMLSALGF